MVAQIQTEGDALAVLTDLYHSYERNIELLPCNDNYKSLVTFDSAKTSCIHRWYNFKEGYSGNLLNHLQGLGIIPAGSDLVFLDPFAGVATSLVSAQLAATNGVSTAIGIERNPALAFIGQAKLNWHIYKSKRVKWLLRGLKASGRGRKKGFSVPGLSTLTATRNGKKAFDPSVLQALLYYRSWIEDHCAGRPEYDFFMLAWTAIVERSSYTRKDGRALRLIEGLEQPPVKALLVSQCELMLDDIEALRKSQAPVAATAYVIQGDGRRLPFADNSFTALCYSPPYLNNIDYSEVYKLELWLRGDVANSAEFHLLRLGTLRSHPSVSFPSTALCDGLDETTWIRRLKSALIATIPGDKFLKMRQRLFSGYIDDMLMALREQFRVAKPGSPIVCVVGNSLHGGKEHHTVPVCTDLLISAAAQAIGLTVEQLQIARQLPRRDNQNGWLRETIIVMRKPRRRYGGSAPRPATIRT